MTIMVSGRHSKILKMGRLNINAVEEDKVEVLLKLDSISKSIKNNYLLANLKKKLIICHKPIYSVSL